MKSDPRPPRSGDAPPASGLEDVPRARPRLATVTTIPLTQWIYGNGQNAFLREAGFELHAISSPGELLDRLAARDGAHPHAVPMTRRVTPLRDLVALVRLVRILRRIRPRILHASTPKAALLGLLAGWICRVPARIFLVRGLVSSGKTGWKRRLLQQAERLSAALAHRVLLNGPSLMRYAVEAGIVPADKAAVPADGMSNGVRAEWLDDGEPLPGALAAFAREKAARGWRVLGFVGRLVPDKGLAEMAEAWERLRERHPGLRLLLIGVWEEASGARRARLRERFERDDRVLVHDFLPRGRLGRAYALMDVLLFPSRREGFPNVPVEAQLCGVPVVTTDAVGCVDAVRDGTTGRIVPVGDACALEEAVEAYLGDDELRRAHGEAGRTFVRETFAPERIWAALLREYEACLEPRNG